MDIKSIYHKSVNTIRSQSNITKKNNEKGLFSIDQKQTTSVNKTIETSVVQSAISFLYEEESVSEQRKRHIKRGKKIIEKLEHLRINFITRVDAKKDMEELMVLLNQTDRLELSDELNAVIDEIETRAAVELAKYEKILSS